ncbi:MAG: hypothetical protein EoVTN8_1080 [Fluviibacter phosphoraccumulans EoVTN8]
MARISWRFLATSLADKDELDGSDAGGVSLANAEAAASDIKQVEKNDLAILKEEFFTAASFQYDVDRLINFLTHIH